MNKKKILITIAVIVVLICGVIGIIGAQKKNDNEEITTKEQITEAITTTEKEATTEKEITTTETETTTEPTTEETTEVPTQAPTYRVNTTAYQPQTTKVPETTKKPVTTKPSGGTGVADINTGIGWDGKPIVYYYTDGTTGNEPKEGAEYEYEEGIWRVVGNLGPVVDDNICNYGCGKTVQECDVRVNDWHCNKCNKDINAFECHPMH